MFYLLEKPRSISDMIKDITKKELSDDAEGRSKEIPSIAGNWFREGEGYIWKLKEEGLIKDIGRQYQIEIEEFLSRFFSSLGIQKCFPEYPFKGDKAEIKASYSKFIDHETLGEFKGKLISKIFSDETMAEVFEFGRWKDVLLREEENDRRTAKYYISADFWSVIHFILISSILKSRRSRIKEKLRDGETYFLWRNRKEQLKKIRDYLADRIVERCFPWEEGETMSDRTEDMKEAFGEKGVKLDEEATRLLGDLYLFSFNEGEPLFQQLVRHANEDHLFFDLLEEGLIIEPNEVDKYREGGLQTSLTEMTSYIDRITQLFNPKAENSTTVI